MKSQSSRRGKTEQSRFTERDRHHSKWTCCSHKSQFALNTVQWLLYTPLLISKIHIHLLQTPALPCPPALSFESSIIPPIFFPQTSHSHDYVSSPPGLFPWIYNNYCPSFKKKKILPFPHILFQPPLHFLLLFKAKSFLSYCLYFLKV